MHHDTVSGLLINPVQTLDSLCSSRPRRDALRDRSTSNPDSSVTPLFHRSDSFARFVKTAGELQGDITALDDEAVTSIRAMSKEDYTATDILMDSRSGKDNETDG
jgi:hypothetical protein